MMLRGRVRCRLDDDAVAGADCGSQLPGRHEQRKIPRNDLADNAEGFLEVIGNRVLVDVSQAAFFRLNAGGEVAEVSDNQGNVGIARLANGLAVVECLRKRQGFEILLQHVRNLQKSVGAIDR